MDFKNQNGAAVQGTATAKEGLNGAAKTAEAKKEAVAAAKPTAKVEPAKDKAAANGTAAATANNQVKAEPEKQEAEKIAMTSNAPEKTEQPQVKPVTIALNLESTLKVVEDLHRRSIQRVNLISRIKQLEAFEVNLTTEHDELEDNPYQGCKLIIEDDKAGRFITTTPGLIRLVSQFIFTACHEKLAEIEAHIVLPIA